jgi:hypothetical protein
MPTSRSMRLVTSALRCYPQRWRSRHGDEAAELATLLIQDGTPAWSIAWSYLIGAARTRLVTGPRRLGAAAGALLLAAGSLGVSLALVSLSAPANAASAAHPAAARPRPASPGPAHPSRTGARDTERRGAAEGCGRRDHC